MRNHNSNSNPCPGEHSRRWDQLKDWTKVWLAENECDKAECRGWKFLFSFSKHSRDSFHWQTAQQERDERVFMRGTKDGIKEGCVMERSTRRVVVKIDKLPVMQPHLVTLPSRFLF